MSRMIRFHQFGDASVLRLEHMNTPQPGPGEVLVRNQALENSRAALADVLLEKERALEQVRASETMLRDSQRHLALAQAAAHTGSWSWDKSLGRNMRWSDELYHLLGLSPGGEIASIRRFWTAIPDEDAEAIRQQITRALAGGPCGGTGSSSGGGRTR